MREMSVVGFIIAVQKIDPVNHHDRQTVYILDIKTDILQVDSHVVPSFCCFVCNFGVTMAVALPSEGSVGLPIPPSGR